MWAVKLQRVIFCRFFHLAVIVRPVCFVLGLYIGGNFSSARSQPEIPKLALVIGNASYSGDGRPTRDQHPPPGEQNNLSTPRNDANDVAVMLRSMHYQVTLATDLDYRAMNDTINDFADKVLKASKNTSVIVYYAGHGVSLGGQNYLIPVRAKLPPTLDLSTMATPVAQSRLDGYAIRAENILGLIGDRPNGITVLIIDACRDTPWDRRVRSISRGQSAVGLSRMDYDGSAIVGFSASPGKTADDGPGQRNSPFAKAFISVGNSGTEYFSDFWIDVTEQVRRFTNSNQEPWISGVLRGKFCLDVCQSSSAGNAQPDRLTQQIEQLYAPLNLTLVQGDVEWAEFQERFYNQFGRRAPIVFEYATNAGGARYMRPLPLSNAEWRVWIDGVHRLFKPRNDALAALITRSPSLLEGGVSDCMKEFLLHKEAFDESLARADVDPSVRTWNPSHGFPRCFVPSVQATLAQLEARQAQAQVAATQR